MAQIRGSDDSAVLPAGRRPAGQPAAHSGDSGELVAPTAPRSIEEGLFGGGRRQSVVATGQVSPVSAAPLAPLPGFGHG